MADEQRASASAAYALAQLRRAIDSLAARLQGASEDLQARFGPAIDGLAHVIAGGRFDKSGRALQPASGRRFLGWATGSHWVLDHADDYSWMIASTANGRYVSVLARAPGLPLRQAQALRAEVAEMGLNADKLVYVGADAG